MIDKIKELIDNNFDNLVNMRNHLHQNPELSGEEFKTQAFIIRYLNSLAGFKVFPSANTGVVGIIKGKKSGSFPCVAFRADIDALAIQDEKTCFYRSKNPGIMHACGHDVHTTVLLGLAYNLSKLRNEFSGCVKLFFQPAEETIGGAERMIEEGWLEDPYVEHVIGLHCEALIPAGSIMYRKGSLYASADMIKITLKGKTSHAAQPEDGIDTIVFASGLIMELQTIISRKIGFASHAVLSFGKISGGEVVNAIAGQVIIEGTLRTFNDEVRDKVLKNIEQIIKYSSLAHDIEYILDIKQSYPVLVNDDVMTDFVVKTAQNALGKERVIKRPHPTAGAEDFAYFAKARPSCFYNLGIANEEKGIINPIHTSNFDVDPQAIYTGCLLQTVLALELLNEGEK